MRKRRPIVQPTDRSTAAFTKQERVVEAAREFVASTSYFRQRKESREAFERLAFALLDYRKAVGRDVE